jgi:hypothetical protein
VQEYEEDRQQDAVNEDHDGGGDQADGVGTNSGEADGFPGEIENEDVENPRNDGKQRNGGLAGTRDQNEKGGVTGEAKEDVESGNYQGVGEGDGSGTTGESVKKNQIRSEGGQTPSDKTEPE